MLLLFPQGQLGNQIFQYQFAKSIVKKGEYIVTSHTPYFSIIDELGNKHFKFIPGKKIWKYVNFLCMKICVFLAKIRIISHIKAKREYYKNYRIEKKGYFAIKGLFKNITFIDGFFINDDIHLNQGLKIKKFYIDEAKQFLSQIPSNLKKVFVHVRRGDYLTWKVLGQIGTALPVSYYDDLIDYFVEKYSNVAFIFLSDDIKRCKDHFGKLQNSYFSENSVGTDLAIMTQCDGAGISASTLSFLGAYYCKRTLEIFGPKFFLGFKQYIWYPNGINSKNFQRIEVLN